MHVRRKSYNISANLQCSTHAEKKITVQKGGTILCEAETKVQQWLRPAVNN